MLCCRETGRLAWLAVKTKGSDVGYTRAVTPALVFQAIRPDQLEVFVNLIQAVAQDFNEPDRMMWNPKRLTPEALVGAYGLEALHLGWVQSEPVATFALIEHDPRFWPDVPAGESLFIHKVAVARAWKGFGLSTQILDFAVREARRRGKRFLRLDTDANRPALCALYERYGFGYVGRVMADDFDAALYELAV